jgi:RND family efflux transporter MFP subunit
MEFRFLASFFLSLLFGIGFLGCSKTIDIKMAEVAMTSVETTVSTVSSGTVEALQVAVLSFAGTGRVEKIQVHLGDIVKKGQRIANLENKDSQALVNQVNNDFETSKKLFSEGLISKAALDEAKKTFEVAKANFDKTEMIAPFDGQISELNLQIGETPTAILTGGTQKAAVRIVDLKPRIIRGQIDEIDLPKVKVGAKARVRIQSVQAQAIESVVTKVIPYISTSKEQERTAQVELHPTKQDNLLPAGASADIEIIVSEKAQALSVPARAIFGVTGKRYVYRVSSGKLEKTDVVPGVGNYETMEILQGLKLGEMVALPSESVEFREGVKVRGTRIAWP